MFAYKVRVPVTYAPSAWVAAVEPLTPRATVQVAPETAVTRITSASMRMRKLPADGKPHVLVTEIVVADVLVTAAARVVLALLTNWSDIRVLLKNLGKLLFENALIY